MGKEIWTPQEVQDLILLQEKVRADGGFYPTEEAMRIADSIRPRWAAELVFAGGDRTLPDKILLTVYNGGIEEWRGRWHIPGGYGTIEDTSFAETCYRLALKEVGVEVKVIRILGHPYLWAPGEHIYGRPLSIYTLVWTPAPVQETEWRRYFAFEELPPHTIEPHRRFIEQFL